MSRVALLNPYELTEVEAKKFGFVDVNLESLALDDVQEDADEDGYTAEDDEDYAHEITGDIVKMLLQTTETISTIKNKFDRELFSNHFKNHMVRYFLFLKAQLLKPNLTYLDVSDEDDENRYFKFQFASIGTRFWQFLTECNLFSRRVLREFSILIYRYLDLHPPEILTIRSEMCKIWLQLATDSEASSNSAKLKSAIDAALKDIDKDELHNHLQNIKQSDSEQLDQERLAYFCKTVGMGIKRNKLTEVLSNIIKSIFPTLKPELVQVAKLDKACFDYRILHYQLSFGIAGSNILDDSTLRLVGQPIVQEMKKLGLKGGIAGFQLIVFDIDADVGSDVGSDEDSDDVDIKDDHRMIVISLASESSSFCKLMDFYLRYEPRFGPMVLLLKYYFTESGLINESYVANESFIWLIIYFLQQTEKAVLPTLSKLKLDKRKSRTDLANFSLDPKSIPASSNQLSLGRLVVKFLDWLSELDFDCYLNPSDGKSHLKDTYQHNVRFDSDQIEEMKDSLCIANPLANSINTSFDKSDLYEWKEAITILKNDHKIDHKNYLLVLTDPEKIVNLDSVYRNRNIPYVKAPPENPYELNSHVVEDLGYPQVSELFSLKVEPKLNRFTNQSSTTTPLVECQFARDFIFTSESIRKIIANYDSDHLQLHYQNIVNYFRHLQSRLQKTNLVEYDVLIQSKYDDYAAYGERFWQFLTECKHFSDPFLRTYSILIYHYLVRIPKNIRKLRTQLCDAYLKIASRPNQVPKAADSKIVSYTPVIRKNLHDKIGGFAEVKGQISHLIEEVYPMERSKKFVDFINEMINSDKELAALKLSLEQTDVLQNDFNFFIDEFCFIVKFESFSKKMDRTTFGMALQVINKSIATRFKFDFYNLTKYTFRFKLSSTIPTSTTSDNFIVKLNSTSRYDYTGNCPLLLSRYSKRFREMVLILYSWIRFYKFSHGAPFYSREFVWFIVHFLQQTDPPVLPPLEQVMKSGDVKSIEASTNKKSTSALIVQFLKFCTEFAFADRVICPLNGTSYPKEEYCKLKKCTLAKDSFSRIENPRSGKPFQLIYKSPEQFVKFVTKLLNEEKIDFKNCIKKLTDPSIKVQAST